MNKNEKDVLKLLLKLSNTFSVSPSYRFIRYNLKHSPFIKPNLFTILCVILSIVAYVMYLQNAIQKDYYDGESASVLRTLLDVLATLSYTVSGLVTMASPIVYRDVWKSFFRLLQEVSLALGSGISHYSAVTKKRCLIDLLILHVIFIFKIFWNCFVWVSEEDIESYMFYIPIDLIEYFTLISLVLMIYLNKIIRQRYLCLNNFVKYFPWLTSRGDKNENTIRNVQVNYRNLGKLVALFNKIFGYQMLLTVEISIISILESFYYALSQGSYLIISWCVVYTGFAFVSINLLGKYVEVGTYSIPVSYVVCPISNKF